jgi:hypothetical protein
MHTIDFLQQKLDPGQFIPAKRNQEHFTDKKSAHL